MRWADFEIERAALRENIDAIKLSAENATHPQGSSRDQVGRVAGQKTSVRNMRSALEAEISANMNKPTELETVSMPWDMPAVPTVSKDFLRFHSANASRIEELRDTFSQGFRKRKELALKDMAIFDL